MARSITEVVMKRAITELQHPLPNTVMLLYVNFMEDSFMWFNDVILHLHGNVLR